MLKHKNKLHNSRRHAGQVNFLDTGHLRRVKFSLGKKYFAVFSWLAVAVSLLLGGAALVASGLEAKQQLTLNANAGVNSLQQASQLLAEQNFSGAEQQLLLAANSFNAAQNDLNSLGGLINSVLKITKQGAAAQNLIAAGNQISQAGINFAALQQIISQVKVSPQGFEAPDGFYGTTNAALKYFSDANGQLAAAQKALAKVDPSVLPANFSQDYLKYRDELASLNQIFSQAYSLLTLFHNFFGPGQKSLLVLFENDAEQRPTGGFIGTYGFFHFNDGKIISQTITSVYDLDGQIKDKIAPPGPFHDLTNHWGLRDSNWFPDFRQSAKKASDFYEIAGKETPDAVVAITPDVFVDLLKVTGPIYFPKYRLSLSADNFRTEIQTATSSGYDKQQNTPKQMLADFAPLFLQALSDLPKNKDPQIFTALLDNLRQKNILFYDRNAEVEQGFENYNWAGEISQTPGDYLQIVNTNLGGRKTDLDVDQSANLVSTVAADGTITNTLTYTRSQKQDLANPDKNIDFIRFYVPQDAKFLSASGFQRQPYYPSDGSGYYDYGQNPNDPYKIDPDLAAFDSTISVDTASGTQIGSDAGKTFFGNWVGTSPGQSLTVTIKYQLPFKYGQEPGAVAATHSLMLQKQPGNNPIHFSYQLDQPDSVQWYIPQSLQISGHKVELNDDLASDQFVGIALSQPGQ